MKILQASIAFMLTLGVSAGSAYAWGTAKTVAEALRAYDDMRVEVEGRIVHHVYKDKYLFRDRTGSITVEIDRDLHRGPLVPGQRLRIRGKVDRDFGHENEIEAKRIYLR